MAARLGLQDPAPSRLKGPAGNKPRDTAASTPAAENEAKLFGKVQRERSVCVALNVKGPAFACAALRGTCAAIVLDPMPRCWRFHASPSASCDNKSYIHRLHTSMAFIEYQVKSTWLRDENIRILCLPPFQAMSAGPFLGSSRKICAPSPSANA